MVISGKTLDESYLIGDYCLKNRKNEHYVAELFKCVNRNHVVKANISYCDKNIVDIIPPRLLPLKLSTPLATIAGSTFPRIDMKLWFRGVWIPIDQNLTLLDYGLNENTESIKLSICFDLYKKGLLNQKEFKKQKNKKLKTIKGIKFRGLSCMPLQLINAISLKNKKQESSKLLKKE